MLTVPEYLLLTVPEYLPQADIAVVGDILIWRFL